MDNTTSVCIYSASSCHLPDVYVRAARDLGRLCACRRVRIVNGAGRTGLMAACSDACLQAGGTVTGVIPSFMIERGWHHTGLTELIETPDIHTRKQVMSRSADAVIALPGGCGTLEELLEIITWKQLGLYLHPIVLLNTRGYYDPLLQVFSRAVDEHFMGLRHASIWHVASTPDEALELIHSLPQWDSSVHKFAAL